MADWNVDLTATLAGAEGGVDGISDTSAPPDSSGPSDGDDGELGFLHQICKSDVSLPPCRDNAFLFDISPSAEKMAEPGGGLLSSKSPGFATESLIQSERISAPASRTPTMGTPPKSKGKSTEDCVPGPRPVPLSLPKTVAPPQTQNERKRKAVPQVKLEPHSDRVHSMRSKAATASTHKENSDLLARDPSTLSPDELKLLKKQRRLVKNRESAQLSRQRKKSHMETLEAQVQQLEMERVALASRMEQLSDENKILKKKLGTIGKASGAGSGSHLGGSPAKKARGTALYA